MNRLYHIIDLFWEWTGYSEPSRRIDIERLAIDPVEYINLAEMQHLCISLINHSLTAKDIDAFLMCMAIDSESECILDACKEYANKEFLQTLISFGVNFPQAQTRWQIAELLRADIPDKNKYLEVLLCDQHPYVRKRAYNVHVEDNDTLHTSQNNEPGDVF